MLLLICLAVVGLCTGLGHDYARIFEHDIDTNHDKIAELSEFEAIFDKDDLDKDGQVTKGEYMQATGDSSYETSLFFDFIDPNRDGVIHRYELPGVLHAFDYDKNLQTDGKVTEAEFITNCHQMRMLMGFVIGK